jgi:hypothetical protein
MVRRNGFKKMVLDTVGRTGVQLWCSVRRSGKTTACFDLGSGGGAQVIVQTMQTLNKDDLSNRFNAQFKNALAERRQISDNFFNDAIAKSIDEPMMQDAKKIFILDEYETLFEQMRAEGNEDDLLRYRVIQPLMNQMIAFSDDNTLVFVGQRPDAYYIYMDQNQLAAYVERRPFPLFEHNAGSIHSEFSALVRKVLTNNASFDSSFVDSVFRETAGHPYLTVNVLKDFYDWLISDGWPSNALDFDGQVFARYVDNCMNTVALGKSLNYEFFKKTLSEYMSIETLRRRPWLYFVTTALKTIAKVSPDTLEADWDAVVADIAAHAGNLADPQELLASAVTSNFLSHEGGRVKPAIPIFGRLAAVCMPNDR